MCIIVCIFVETLLVGKRCSSNYFVSTHARIFVGKFLRHAIFKFHFILLRQVCYDDIVTHKYVTIYTVPLSFDRFPLTDQLRIEKFEAEVNNLKENVLAISALIVEEIKGTQSERLILESLPEVCTVYDYRSCLVRFVIIQTIQENEESFNEMENVDMKMSPDLSSN